jgi:hypothetical protein
MQVADIMLSLVDDSEYITRSDLQGVAYAKAQGIIKLVREGEA